MARSRSAWALALAALLPVALPGAAEAQNRRSQLPLPRDAVRAGGGLQAGPESPGTAPAAAPAAPAPDPERAPVTFVAETVRYDEPTQTVTAEGRVEAWQNDRVLQADRVSFNRATGRARASGNVVILEPDGQVLFAEEAELSRDFSEGIAAGLSGRLAENGRLVAAGARRREGRVTEMYRSLYTTCNACAENPDRAPLWQIRAPRAQHDQLNKRVEYWNPTLEMAGIPVFWAPYLFHADPSVKRASGVLPPLIGRSRYLGAFASLPYYHVIDDNSDMTIEPMITANERGLLGGEYRRRFNSGYTAFRGSGTFDSRDDWRGHILGLGRFSVDETWKTGFDVARASDISYLRNYRFGSPRVLTTRPYLEGFGNGAFARLDAFSYQGLRVTDSDKRSPQVLPRGLYEYVGTPDAWGGRLSVDATAYNIFRIQGADQRRFGGRANWTAHATDGLGSRLTYGGNLDLLAWNYDDNPASGSGRDSGTDSLAHPQAFAMWRFPVAKRYASFTHVIEPIVQAMVGPNTGRGRRVNEDSRDVEFTDANLFALNRFPGRDLLEGGTRLNYALRSAVHVGSGTYEALIGQSARPYRDDTFDAQSGLRSRVSDFVTRVSADPAPWLGLSYRARYAPDQMRQTFSDISASVGVQPLRVSGSYVLLPPSLTGNRLDEREEVGAGISLGPFETGSLSTGPLAHWRARAGAYRDLKLDRWVSTTFGLTYEDECFVFDLRYQRSYTTPGLQAEGGTTVLFQLVFKTVGEFGFSAL
jgi:LPS-assembly protein